MTQIYEVEHLFLGFLHPSKCLDTPLHVYNTGGSGLTTKCFRGAWMGCMIMKPTWVCPAISMPASRNSSKSWLNFPEAAASWLLVPREEWTTSPAEWLSSAAVWFKSVWASWNVLLQGGSFKDKRHINLAILFCVIHKMLINLQVKSRAGLTMSTSSFLLASPMLLRAMSTSFWPGKQFTQLFKECDTALAT